MGSVVRRMRRRKRSLGKVRVLRREEYQGLELNAKVEMIRSLIPLGLMHVQMLLEEEVEALAGPRYGRADGASGMRHGSNPGTVVLDGQKEAHAELTKLHRELEDRNQSAAASLAEGLEETLTLHRLGVYGVLGVSFKTTNCLESTNALVEERCAKVDVWKNSNQRHRWLATALLDIEQRLRRVKGHRHLPKLEAALRQALNVKERSTKLEEAA